MNNNEIDKPVTIIANKDVTSIGVDYKIATVNKPIFEITSDDISNLQFEPATSGPAYPYFPRAGGSKKQKNKKTFQRRDKLGRFIKRKTRKSSGGWLN